MGIYNNNEPLNLYDPSTGFKKTRQPWDIPFTTIDLGYKPKPINDYNPPPGITNIGRNVLDPYFTKPIDPIRPTLNDPFGVNRMTRLMPPAFMPVPCYGPFF